MATTKTSSKSPTPKTNPPTLPEPKTFTEEQLAERWNYSLATVEGRIRDGDLKKAFDTVELDAYLNNPFYNLHDIHFYKHYVGDGEGFKIDRKHTLEELVGSVAKDNLIPCSETDFLYLPREVSARKVGTGKEDYIRFFCDVDGNQLIPTHTHGLIESPEGHPIRPLPVDKHLFDKLLIIPLEEVDRFEIKYKIGEKARLPKNGKKILDIMDEMKQHPRKLPSEDKHSGKHGTKNDVRKIYLKRYKGDQTELKVIDQFDTAWEALMKKGFIRYVP